MTAKTSQIQLLPFCVLKLCFELGSTCTMSEIRNQTAVKQYILGQRSGTDIPFFHSLANIQLFFIALKARFLSHKGGLKDVK